MLMQRLILHGLSLLYNCSMLGSILILGGDKKGRLDKAWGVLATHGFKLGANSLDLLVVQKEEGKKSVGIAQAREVKDFFKEKPFERRIKAVLIEDAQLFTDDAQGSLLKILEEPPVFGLIILLCDKEGSLLPTVVSRCQRIVVSRASLNRSGEQDEEQRYCLSKYTYDQLFDLTKELSARGKEESLEFLEQVLRNDIKTDVSLDIVKKTEQAIKELRNANVALNFALEYLFLLHSNNR